MQQHHKKRSNHCMGIVPHHPIAVIGNKLIQHDMARIWGQSPDKAIAVDKDVKQNIKKKKF